MYKRQALYQSGDYEGAAKVCDTIQTFGDSADAYYLQGLCYMAVSYTHLDVYKRQIYGKAKELVPVLSKDAITKLIIKQAVDQLNSCLLYTSRSKLFYAYSKHRLTHPQLKCCSP